MLISMKCSNNLTTSILAMNADTFRLQTNSILAMNADTFQLLVTYGQTYLLRIINAALNTELFFLVAHHDFIIVCLDASYTNPYTTKVIMLGPGKITDVLLTANKHFGKYYMASQEYSSSSFAPFNNSTTTAILEYKGSPYFFAPSVSQPAILQWHLECQYIYKHPSNLGFTRPTNWSP